MVVGVVFVLLEVGPFSDIVTAGLVTPSGILAVEEKTGHHFFV